MGKKILVLLGVVGGLSPLMSGTLAEVVLVTVLLTFVVVLIVLFNQKANTRLVRLITALSSSSKNRISSKKN